MHKRLLNIHFYNDMIVVEVNAVLGFYKRIWDFYLNPIHFLRRDVSANFKYLYFKRENKNQERS